MATFKYVFIEYDINEQNLSVEDVHYLLTANYISPFALIRRSVESAALPILSHPDFAGETLKAKTKNLSTDCKRFINYIRRLRKASQTNSELVEDSFSKLLHDRRHPLPAVAIKYQTTTLLAALMSREKKILTVVTPSLNLRIGQTLELTIMVSYKKERLEGVVKSYEERADRRKPGQIFYTYKIEQTKVL